MTDDTPEPLWQVVVGDKEAWRKGRLFLIAFAILNFVTDAVSLTRLVAGGVALYLAIYAAFRLIFWIQFYFVWIGVHWVRWLLGGLSAIVGFCQLVWSFEAGSGLMGAIGLFYIGTGLFLGFAPPVHQFAIRQKEHRNWPEMIGMAAGGALLLASFAIGVVVMLRYQEWCRRDAAHFADTAFDSIYRHQDGDFLARHATTRILELANGSERLTSFPTDWLRQGGSAYEIEPADGFVLLRYQFPLAVWGTGNMRAEGTGPYGKIVFQMQVVGAPGNWQIDGIAWVYPMYSANRRR